MALKLSYQFFLSVVAQDAFNQIADVDDNYFMCTNDSRVVGYPFLLHFPPSLHKPYYPLFEIGNCSLDRSHSFDLERKIQILHSPSQSRYQFISFCLELRLDILFLFLSMQRKSPGHGSSLRGMFLNGGNACT